MPTSQCKSSGAALIKDRVCFDTGSEKLMLDGIFELDTKMRYNKIKKVTVISVTTGSGVYTIGQELENLPILLWTVIDCLNCNC